jgi:shikimate dehydrogenase
MSTASRRTLAVLGSPIRHSRSPALHDAAYAVLGLDWDYRTIDMTSDRLAGFITSRGAEWRGLSLTMPLKHTVMPLLSSLDATARLTGAANTLLFDTAADGSVTRSGFNTDVAGIVRALGAASLGPISLVHILGSGATAASAVAAAAELGAQRVVIWARTPQRAAALVPLAGSLGLTTEIRAQKDGVADPAAELVISTLPGGADAGVSFSTRLRERALLFDVAYDPWPSTLAASWQAAGGRVLSGLAMLTHQALLQVRVFVCGDPLLPLDNENAVLAAMLEAVHLDQAGRPIVGDTGDGGDAQHAVPES